MCRMSTDFWDNRLSISAFLQPAACNANPVRIDGRKPAGIYLPQVLFLPCARARITNGMALHKGLNPPDGLLAG